MLRIWNEEGEDSIEKKKWRRHVRKCITMSRRESFSVKIVASIGQLSV